MKQNSKPIFGIFGFFSSGPWIIRYSAKKKYSDSIFGFQNFNIRIRLRSAEYSVFGSNTRIRIDIPALDAERLSLLGNRVSSFLMMKFFIRVFVNVYGSFRLYKVRIIVLRFLIDVNKKDLRRKSVLHVKGNSNVPVRWL